MRWGYVLGPLTLVPLLGALFLLPRPNGDDPLRFDRASLSLLTCHSPAGGILALPATTPPPRSHGLRQLERHALR
ncbi:MAG: hypothetical protein IH609_13875 [Dehalococcoidia bacterium]|nr:hypothetical protein [Dehalococcoidia bacterium]